MSSGVYEIFVFMKLLILEICKDFAVASWQPIFGHNC